MTIENTDAIPDTCHDFFVNVGGEVCELLIPQSRREYHLLEAVRAASRDYDDNSEIDPKQFRVGMLGYTAGNAKYAVFRRDEDETIVAENLFPCLLISGSGNRTHAAMLDVLGSKMFFAPSWQPQPVEWNGGEPDAEGLATLLRKLSSSPIRPDDHSIV